MSSAVLPDLGLILDSRRRRRLGLRPPSRSPQPLTSPAAVPKGFLFLEGHSVGRPLTRCRKNCHLQRLSRLQVSGDFGEIARWRGDIPVRRVLTEKGSCGGKKNLLRSFAYSFITINRLIQCPSLHSDNLNTHLHFELPFSLQSLALQTTHSIANNSFLSPCPCCLPGSSLPSHITLGCQFHLGAKPQLQTLPCFGGAHPQIQTTQLELLSAFLSPHSCAPATLFLRSSSHACFLAGFSHLPCPTTTLDLSSSAPADVQEHLCVHGHARQGGISSSSLPPCGGTTSGPSALASSPVPPEGKCRSLTFCTNPDPRSSAPCAGTATSSKVSPAWLSSHLYPNM